MAMVEIYKFDDTKFDNDGRHIENGYLFSDLIVGWEKDFYEKNTDLKCVV